MNDYRNPRNVVGNGTIATALTGNRYATARTAALAAMATTGIVDWQDAKTVDWHTLDPLGPINGKNGKNIVRRRWDTAYRAHVAYFDLPVGIIYVPCYICGELFDAWTLDVEHVFGRLEMGTVPGGILLACSGCNTDKGNGRRIPWQLRDMLMSSVAANVGYSRTGKECDANWHARTRRVNGSTQSSTPYSG